MQSVCWARGRPYYFRRCSRVRLAYSANTGPWLNWNGPRWAVKHSRLFHHLSLRLNLLSAGIDPCLGAAGWAVGGRSCNASSATETHRYTYGKSYGSCTSLWSLVNGHLLGLGCNQASQDRPIVALIILRNRCWNPPRTIAEIFTIPYVLQYYWTVDATQLTAWWSNQLLQPLCWKPLVTSPIIFSSTFLPFEFGEIPI